MVPRAITREQLALLPIRGYEGDVSLVATSAELERARAKIAGEVVVGFDTETRPAFRKGESYLPSLIQVATAGTVYIFQLSRLDCSSVLAELLGSPSAIKAGIGLKYDLEQLKLRFPFEPAAVIDLGKVAMGNGFQQSGVRNLAGLFLGFRISKGAQTSNWAAPSLSMQQIRYAATDAWACRELYLRFRDLGLVAAP